MNLQIYPFPTNFFFNYAVIRKLIFQTFKYTLRLYFLILKLFILIKRVFYNDTYLIFVK